MSSREIEKGMQDAAIAQARNGPKVVKPTVTLQYFPTGSPAPTKARASADDHQWDPNDPPLWVRCSGVDGGADTGDWGSTRPSSISSWK